MIVMKLLPPPSHRGSKATRRYSVLMTVTSTKNQSLYGIDCIRCDDRLIAPNWSAYMSENHVRHSWSCESCGHQFETSDLCGLTHPLRLACKSRSLARIRSRSRRVALASSSRSAWQLRCAPRAYTAHSWAARGSLPRALKSVQ